MKLPRTESEQEQLSHKEHHKIVLLIIKELLRRIMTSAPGESSHQHHQHSCYGGGGGTTSVGGSYLYQKTARRAVPILTWLIPFGAIASVINVAISMCTGEWLHSYERIPTSSSNSTNKDEVHIKTTVSGLWTLCYANTTEELDNMHCFSIDYFSKDRYTSEPHDSTNAIPYTVTKAGPLFIVASILLGLAIFSATVGYLWRKYRIATFVAGIIFIISGLIMLIGLVVYLSVLQSEIGTKLRARNSLDAPPFRYSYGYGFILVVVGFMLTELTGTCAIFWYIYWHQLDWARKESCGNGDIVIRPLSNGFEREINYTSSHNPHWSFNEANNSSSSCRHHQNHNHRPPSHHHHPPGPGHGSELNSYYTYSAQGTSGGNGNGGVSYCKKHGGNHSVGFQLPSCNCNNTSSKKYRHHHSKHHNNQFYHHYDDDIDILDVPFPPPPQRQIPRDITCTTTVSSDDFFGSSSAEQHQRDSRDLRKTTPV